jgi:hypothetical protein
METLLIGYASVRTNPALIHATPARVARLLCSQDGPRHRAMLPSLLARATLGEPNAVGAC